MNGLGTASPGTATEIVLLDPEEHVIGRLRFRACPTCRTGRILDVWVCDARQRQGLGRDLVHSVLARCPGFQWSTTAQTRDGRGFFETMARESAVPLPHGGPLCCHLMGGFRRTWHGLLDRRQHSGSRHG